MTKTTKKSRGLLSAVLLTCLLTAATTSPMTPASATEQPQPAAAVVGQGWLAKAACIGCLAAFGIAGGGTLVGVMIVAGAFPEAAAGCALGCVAAFS